MNKTKKSSYLKNPSGNLSPRKLRLVSFFVILEKRSPVKSRIVLISEVFEEILEQVLDVLVVRLVLEIESSAVLHIGNELLGEPSAKIFEVGHDLLLLDLLVLLLDAASPEALPRELSSQEVHEHVPDALHVVAASLLDPDVGIDGGVSGGSGQTLAVLVLDVLTVGRHELLGEAEIDDEDPVRVLSAAGGKVIGLDVSVDDTTGVDVLDPLDGLLGDHQDGLDRELPAAQVEQVLETLAEQVHDHEVVVALGAVVQDLGNCLADDGGIGVEPQVDLAFVVQLLVLRVHILELNRYLLFGFFVNGLPDLSEGAASQFLLKAVMLCYDSIFHFYNINLNLQNI